MFKVSIIETTDDEKEIERYSQTVDSISLPAVIAAINRPVRAPRKDKGIRKGEANGGVQS